jgi:hypothetical protein
MEFDYIKESAKTNNTDTNGILARLSHKNRFLKLLSLLADYSVICEQLDVFKKGIFYGKEQSLESVDQLEIPVFVSILENHFKNALDNADFDFVNLLHGIVGKATEIGELVDAFAQPLSEGKTFDLINIGEEIGDDQWYSARVLETIRKTFDEVQMANLRKLQDKASGRYKQGSFNSDEAIIRDVKTERTNLEANLT